MEDYSKPFDILANLPRIRKRKIWEVIMDGKVVQLVGATDNRKITAERYIANKYPNAQFTLKFLEYRIQSPNVGVDKQKSFSRLLEKKERRKMGMMIQSDCCNEPMSGSQIDHEICPCCGEHCVVISDED